MLEEASGETVAHGPTNKAQRNTDLEATPETSTSTGTSSSVDSRNALTFNKMFTDFAPDIFVDTHTSNGADYPAEMTLICTQPDKLGGPPWPMARGAHSFQNCMVEMEKRGPAMTPYVYSLKSTPDSGIQDYLETPRYSTGYAALHHTIGFTSEAHMLKPFDQRG